MFSLFNPSKPVINSIDLELAKRTSIHVPIDYKHEKGVGEYNGLDLLGLADESVQDACCYLKAKPNITVVETNCSLDSLASLLEIKSLFKINGSPCPAFKHYGQESEEKLAQAIANNSTLLELSLPILSPNGTALVVNAVKSSALKTISLSVDYPQGNLIDSCFKSIADNLIKDNNSCIETLYLHFDDGDKIGEACLNQITEALKTNTNLKSLYLYGFDSRYKLSDACIFNFVQVIEKRGIPVNIGFNHRCEMSGNASDALAKSNYIVSFAVTNYYYPFPEVVAKADENKKRFESEAAKIQFKM